MWELPRNDLAACEALYRRRKGRISPDEMSVMLRLQDDHTELLELALKWESEFQPKQEE